MYGRAGILLLVASLTLSCATGPVGPQSAPRQWFREGQGRTVVMLGGGVYGAAMFAPHARELANEFDVIRVQTLNVQTAESGTPMPLDYSVDGEVSALRKTLSYLRVVDPVDLVGASYGAVVALHYAVTDPEHVRTVTLFEPPAFWILSPEEYDRDPALREMVALTAAMSPSSEPSDQQFFRFRCLLGACPPAVPASSDPARAEWDRNRKSMRGLAAIPAHREDRERLALLPLPVLLLTGSKTVGFHRRINELLARAIPHVETAELHGTHSAPGTASAEMVQTLREFLSRH